MKCIKTLLFIAALIFADYSIAQLPGCGTSIAAFPYTEGFEASSGNWTDDVTEQFNWTRDSGGTTSGSTGPTTGSAASTWYMYIETSAPRVNGDQAWLESDCFNFGALTAPRIEFDYHMYGASTGTLDFLISTDGVVWTSIWTLSGNQGNSWQTASVDLTAYAGLTVGFQFRGTRGTSYTGDIAIDGLTIFNQGPITFQSSTTTQASTGAVENCATSAEILGIEIVTTGTTGSLTATEFTVNTTGTTSLADLSAINIYYTGTSPAFATGSLFGTIGPAGSVVINGSQALVSGTNYFWVEYGLNPLMTNGNTLDGTCSSLVVSAVSHVPTVTSPAGLRSIGACNPSAGGVAGNLQTWFDANIGTVGNPVLTWNNQGPNANITALTSTNGGPVANSTNANFNNIITTTGGYNGTYHAEVSNRTQVISGTGVTMYVAYQGQSNPDLSFEFHGSTQTSPGSNSAAQWLTWGFRHGGIGSLFGDGTSHLYDAVTQAQMSENSGFVGLHGTSVGTGGNNMNGSEMNFSVGTFPSGSNFMELSVGYWPGYGMSRGVMEAILWDRDLSATERRNVETYLAIKYGVTLGMNGVSLNYTSPSSGAVVWDIAANAGFNYDVAGMARADISGLDQRKSHSTNGPTAGVFNDILTVVNGVSFAAPAAFPSDRAFFIWGHNNDPIINTGVVVNYPTDNGEVIETIIQREWKSQENGVVNGVTLEFDLSAVAGPANGIGNNDLANLRLLVDEDGDYTAGATSIAPSSFNNITGIAYFQHDFIAASGNPLDQNRGFFFTLGSTDSLATPLPVELVHFEVTNEDCSNLIEWSTASESNSDYYVIERSYDLAQWEQVGTVSGAGNSTQTLDYIYRDNDFEMNGLIYYRIVQFDFDGSNSEIGLQVVNSFCEDNYEPIAYPNPVTNELSIKSMLAGRVTVMDLNGRIVSQSEVAEGTTVVGMSHLTQGTYMMTIELSNGKTFMSQLVKM